MKPTRLDYCQYLLTTQINYTMTNHANHHETFSHDAINRYLKNDTITTDDIWNNIKKDIVQSKEGCLIFDDTVIDKNHSSEIELVKRQYSGNVHGLIKGIGLVNCIYVNPKTEQYWIIDYRIYDAAGDGKTKLQHAKEMRIDAVKKSASPLLRCLWTLGMPPKTLCCTSNR